MMSEAEQFHYQHMNDMDELLRVKGAQWKDEPKIQIHLNPKDLKDRISWMGTALVAVFFLGMVAGAAFFMVGFWIGLANTAKLVAIDSLTSIKIPIDEIDRGAIIIGRAEVPTIKKIKRTK